MHAKLPKFNLGPERLETLSTCIRPFRAEGPRLETEVFGPKRVIHNYGHGGAGWSLSWGCAEEAADLALHGRSGVSGAKTAVIGAGAIGLTTALTLARRGVAVTIYADRLGHETRSARATGRWSPASRLAFRDRVGDAFSKRWRRWTTWSGAAHRKMGQAVHDAPIIRVHGEADRPACRHVFFDGPDDGIDQTLVFDIEGYMRALERELIERGARLVRRRFRRHTDCLALEEDVIVNCSGYGARTLWSDATLTPVRGQIARFRRGEAPPMAVIGAQAQLVSRPDAVILQYTGRNDDWGFGVDDEVEDARETDLARAALKDHVAIV